MIPTIQPDRLRCSNTKLSLAEIRLFNIRIGHAASVFNPWFCVTNFSASCWLHKIEMRCCSKPWRMLSFKRVHLWVANARACLISAVSGVLSRSVVFCHLARPSNESSAGFLRYCITIFTVIRNLLHKTDIAQIHWDPKNDELRVVAYNMLSFRCLHLWVASTRASVVPAAHGVPSRSDGLRKL